MSLHSYLNNFLRIFFQISIKWIPQILCSHFWSCFLQLKFNFSRCPLLSLSLLKLGVNLPFLFWLLLNLYSLNFIFLLFIFPAFFLFQFRNFSRALKITAKPGQIKNRFRFFFFHFFPNDFLTTFILSSNSVDTK